MTTTLVGPSYFPSAAYLFVSGQGSMLSKLYVVKPGTAPLDDYTGEGCSGALEPDNYTGEGHDG